MTIHTIATHREQVYYVRSQGDTYRYHESAWYRLPGTMPPPRQQITLDELPREAVHALAKRSLGGDDELVQCPSCHGEGALDPYGEGGLPESCDCAHGYVTIGEAERLWRPQLSTAFGTRVPHDPGANLSRIDCDEETP